MNKIHQRILQLGAGLSYTKELRDLFEDIVEKIISACKPTLTRDDLLTLLTALPPTFPTHLESSARFAQTFARLLAGISPVILRLYR